MTKSEIGECNGLKMASREDGSNSSAPRFDFTTFLIT